MSPNTDILMTPKEPIKTPKTREFPEMIKSPKEDSLNTPLPLTTPNNFLSTPTLTTPQTADWGLFSPINLGGSPCSSPHDLKVKDSRPSNLPLDSTIGLSSPHDGVLAKRRKLKNLNSSRSIESDSNSCDTPTADCEPRDLSRKGCERVRLASDSSTQDEPSPDHKSFGRGREKGDAFPVMFSPKWFKHPKLLPENMKLGKENSSDLPSSYQKSPLAVPSPNWTTISALLSSDGLALKTPKVLDNFVFDVLPPNTPNTPKTIRERSPDKFPSLNNEKSRLEDTRIKPKPEGRVTFAEPPRPQSLTPPPPYPEDLSIPRVPEVTPKQECESTYKSSPSPPEYSSHHEPIKDEPQDYSNIPHDFPPYYLHPQIHPHQLYRPGVNRPTSPPASPPRLPSSSQGTYAYQQACKQFYNSTLQQSLCASGLPNYNFVSQGGSQYNYWGGGNHQAVSEMGGPHSNISTSNVAWGSQREEKVSYNKTGVAENIRSVSRLSTDSHESDMKMGVKRISTDDKRGDGEQNGQPPKKRGKAKGKNPDSAAPKRVFVCPHCQRSYDWNYNLNRHLKYECGKENSFMCSKCGRKFPHKQNCVYHLKRKHKIMFETIDQYVSNGLVVFQGKAGEVDHNSPSDSNGYSPAGSGGPQVVEPSPPPAVSLQG